MTYLIELTWSASTSLISVTLQEHSKSQQVRQLDCQFLRQTAGASFDITDVHEPAKSLRSRHLMHMQRCNLQGLHEVRKLNLACALTWFLRGLPPDH